MFGYAFGQAGPLDPGGFCFGFGTTTVGSHSFKSIEPAHASIMKMALVGWEAVQPPSGPLVEDALAIVHQPPDADDVVAAPFVQTAPRQVGNMYRWVEMQLARGKGIVLVLPDNFTPCGDLLRWTSGQLRAVATNDTAVAAQLAGPSDNGVAVFAPAAGWGNGAPATPPPTTTPEYKIPWAPLAAFGVALVGAWWLFKR